MTRRHGALAGLSIVLGEGGADPQAETMRRCVWPAINEVVPHEVDATALQVAPNTLTMAAFGPSGASEMASLVPGCGGRACPEELDPERPGIAMADGHAQHLAPPVAVDPDSDDYPTETM